AKVWQSPTLTKRYLEGVRGSIPLAAEQLDVMLRLLAAQPAPARRFLDLGCGDGVLAATILDRFPGAQGVLLDFSSPMLDAARRRCPHCIFLEEDYGSPSWLKSVQPWAPFDAIVSGFSIHHQPDSRKRQLFREFASLLPP